MKSEVWLGDNMEFMSTFPDKFFDLAIPDPPYGIAICGFSISYLQTINVKKIGLGTKKEQIIYATGAMFGGCIGVLITKNII